MQYQNQQADPTQYMPPPKKRHTVRNVILVALLVVFVVVVASCLATANQVAKEISDGPTTATVPATTTAAPATGKKWVAVTTLKGTAGKNSDTIHLTGGKVRITYTFTGEPTAAIYILKEGVDPLVDGAIPEVMVTRTGTDSTIVRKAAGDYYVNVTSVNSGFTVSVAEER